MTGESETPPPGRQAGKPRFRPWLTILGLIVLALVGLALSTPLLLRTPAAISRIEAVADGLPAGRLGHLEVSGLAGDPLGHLTLDRLAIRDADGIWLEARSLDVTWEPTRLLAREVRVVSASADRVHILRRPVLAPPKPHKPLPVTVTVTRLSAVIESDPAFSTRRGVFSVKGGLQVRRGDGGYSAGLKAVSRLRDGDHLDAVLDVGKDRPLRLRADALEANGGALAGVLGLPADRPFRMTLDADGRMDQGRVRADLRSGDIQPVALSGTWSPSSGTLSGQIDLSASSLTRPVAERIGARLKLDGRAEGVADDRGAYIATLTLTTDAASAQIRGPLDFEHRRVGGKGLDVQVTTPSLRRILGAGVDAGRARISGRLLGDPETWNFTGEGRVEQTGLGGYRLGSASGPIALESRKGRIGLNARIQGGGGRGEGLVFALLGASPSLNLKVARQDDGEILIEDMKAAGSGFQASGSGRRSLLGGLTFAGNASVSRLDAGLPGASGGLTARWNARLPKAQSPWEVTVSARGDKLATGLKELDRLLGGTPDLDARFFLRNRSLRFERLDLRGAALQVRAPGAALEGDAITGRLEWSALGPFAAGPVEVSGKASGTGRLEGSISAPSVTMNAAFDAIQLPGMSLTGAQLDLDWSRSGGSAQVRAASPFGPASARTRFAFPEGGIQLNDILVDAGGLRAGGQAALVAGGASAADLTIELTPGAFLAEGLVTGKVRLEDRRASGPWVDADLVARNALLPGEGISIVAGRLSAQGPLSRLPFELTARGQTNSGDWALEGRGFAAQQGERFRIDFDGAGEAGGRRVRTTETAVLELAGAERRARLRFGIDKAGSVAVDLTSGPGMALVTGSLDDMPASLFNPDLAGRMDANFRVEGKGSHLVGQANGSLADVRARDSEVSFGLNGHFRADLANEQLALQADVSNARGMKADGQVDVPVRTRLASLLIQPDRERPLRGRVQANGEIRPLWDLFVGGDQTLSGLVALRGELSGTLAAPRAAGHAEIENGAFTDAATGLVLKTVTVRSRLSETAIQIDQATGADGQGGTLSGSGLISLQGGAPSSFRLDLVNFRVIDNELATATASGQASVTRAGDGRVTLQGGLTINRADVRAAAPTPTGVTPLAVTEINQPVLVGRKAEGRGAGPAVAMDVTLKAPQGVFIRGQGLDLEMSVDARVTGTTARPRLTGLARILQGSYAFADKRFEIDPSGVVYLSEDPSRIRLDLAAVRADPALTAIVRIRGTAAKPDITLTSTPPLPTDEIFSQVLFGRSASQLSPLETAQLASAVASMAGGGGLDVIGNLRGLAGLDRLSFAGGGNGDGVEVSGGKYLTKNVLLIVTGGGREGGSAQVEWNVSRSLRLISKLSGEGENTLSVRWRRDY